MNRRLLVLLAGGALGACDTQPTAPERAGRLVLSLAVPIQAALVDQRGSELQLSELRVALGTPVLLAAQCGAAACPSPGQEAPVLQVSAGAAREWVTWDGLASTPDSVRFAFSPVTQDALLAPGSSLALVGTLAVFQPDLTVAVVPYTALMPWRMTITIPFPDHPALQSEGARYRVVLDPAAWLIDPMTHRAVSLDALTGPLRSDADPIVVALRQRAATLLRLVRE